MLETPGLLCRKLQYSHPFLGHAYVTGGSQARVAAHLPDERLNRGTCLVGIDVQFTQQARSQSVTFAQKAEQYVFAAYVTMLETTCFFLCQP
jgi:hypothetical protein